MPLCPDEFIAPSGVGLVVVVKLSALVSRCHYRPAYTLSEPPMSSDVHYLCGETCKGEFEMLYWALVFLLIAIVAGAVGFGGVAVAFAGLAKIVFFIFLVLLVVSLVAHVRA